MIQVLKRDGSRQRFSVRKLAAGICRATSAESGDGFHRADDLAQGVRLYLLRRQCRRVSSAAVFEMVQQVLRRLAMPDVADAMEAHRLNRSRRRSMLRHREEYAGLSPWPRNSSESRWQRSSVCCSDQR